MTVKDKIEQLRSVMRGKGIDAFIVFSADPHMSEYLPEEWKERTWLTGFSGSAGFAVITLRDAALWTDGRYFLQAENQLEDSGIQLMKEGIEGTPTYTEWLLKELPENSKVAVNALATARSNWLQLEKALKDKNITLTDEALLDSIWTSRVESVEKNKIFIHPVERAGKSVGDKLSAIHEKMKQAGADAHITSSLDDVAWTLNLRGSDVEANPVFLAYLLLIDSQATLYVDAEKLSDEVRNYLNDENITVKNYEAFYPDLAELSGHKILLSPAGNQKIYQSVAQNNSVIEAPVPGNLMKAQKNAAELDGFRTVMVRDGVAMVNFLFWLQQNVGKTELTEYSIGQKLHEFRAAQGNFVGNSFGYIIGYRENGAIIHYSAPEHGSKEVKAEASILIDSGGQYREGTTDITRTLALGEHPEEFKVDYTLVLQGMIRLSMAQFPRGTRGVQLDILARQPLWLHGKDYQHGTGHGVGSFMNVHEGPQNIRKDLNPQELLPGMVVSNEPGFYKEGDYGIRLENLIAVSEFQKSEYGQFYHFETLTICPFQTELIIKDMLLPQEISWLNDYHKWCGEKLKGKFAPEVDAFFRKMIQAI